MSGGGFGALDSMNKSIKNNRGLVRKVSAFERMKSYSSALKGKRAVFTDKKLSKDELLKLRLKTIKEDRIHTLLKILKLVFVLTVLTTLLFILISGPFNR